MGLQRWRDHRWVISTFCTPLGHGRREIAEAVYQQMLANDYTPHFQLGHPGSFDLAERVCRLLPDQFNHVFFTNSGSESIETAIKVVLAYQRASGQAQRNRLISCERAYHGVNMGGVSLAGMVRNRETFGLTLPNISLIRHMARRPAVFERPASDWCRTCDGSRADCRKPWWINSRCSLC